MAEPGADIGQLSENQQQALQQYLAITDSDPSIAIPLLQRSQWNVNVRG
jgi:FAS-associated factor 2